jgi:hypothetical protein
MLLMIQCVCVLLLEASILLFSLELRNRFAKHTRLSSTVAGTMFRSWFEKVRPHKFVREEATHLPQRSISWIDVDLVNS